MNKGYTFFWALDGVMNCRNLPKEARRGFYEGIVIPTLLYEADACLVRAVEIRNFNLLEIKCSGGEWSE